MKVISKVMQKFKREIAFSMIAVLLTSSMSMYVEAGNGEDDIDIIHDDVELIDIEDSVDESDDEAGTHIHDGKTFQPWSVSNNLPDKAGNYYLENDVELESTWYTVNGEISICLNGHKIIRDAKDYAIEIGYKSQLNLFDCSEKKGMVGGDNCLSVVNVYGELNLYDGILNGTGVAVRLNKMTDVGGKLSQYGGEIRGSSGVVVSEYSFFTMYGGVIESFGNNSVGLYNVGTTHIYDGEIIGSNIGRGAIDSDGIELSIEGGIIRGIDNKSLTGSKGVVIVSGGSFIGPVVNKEADISISGGYYSEDLDKSFIVNGYELVSHKDELLPFKVRKAIPRIDSVSISGNCFYGENLFAIVTPDNTDNLQYQWYRESQLIENANTILYTISDNDINHSVSVCVIQTITDEEVEEITLFSEPTEKILKAPTLSKPSISVNNNFYEKDGSVVVELTEYDSSRKVQFRYRMKGTEEWTLIETEYDTCDNGVVELNGFTPGIFEISCRYTESDLYQASEWVNVTAELGYTENNVELADVFIEGLPYYGEVLTARIEPAEANRVTYQWYRDDKPIDGSVSKNYLIVKEDISCKISVAAKQKFGSVSNDVISSKTETIKKALAPDEPIVINIYDTSDDELGSVALDLGVEKAGEELQMKYRYLGEEWNISDETYIVDENGYLRIKGLSDGNIKISLRYVETETRQASAWRTISFSFSGNSSGEAVVVGDFKLWATDGKKLVRDQDYSTADNNFGRKSVQILTDRELIITLKDGVTTSQWSIDGPNLSSVKCKYNKTNTVNLTLRNVIIDRRSGTMVDGLDDEIYMIDMSESSLNLKLQGNNYLIGQGTDRDADSGIRTGARGGSKDGDGTLRINGQGVLKIAYVNTCVCATSIEFRGGYIDLGEADTSSISATGRFVITGGFYSWGDIYSQEVFYVPVTEGYKVVNSGIKNFPYKVISDGSEDGIEEVSSQTEVNKLLIEPKTCSIGVGTKIELHAIAMSSDPDANIPLEWRSSNENVAKVDSNGVVTAVFPGKATITATTVDGRKIKASCKLTVGGEITAVNLKNKKNITEIEAGKTLQLKAEFMTNNGFKVASKKLVWESSNPEVAIVSEKGLITAVSVSTEPVIITATPFEYYGKGTSIYGSYKIMVSSASKAKRINEGDLFVRKGKVIYKDGDYIDDIYIGKSSSLSVVNALGKKIDLKSVILYSSDESVISCSGKGKLKALKPGEVVITAVSLYDNSIRISVKLKCKQRVKKIVLNAKKVTNQVGGRGIITVAQFNPQTTTDQKVSFTASDCMGKNGIKAVNGVSVRLAILPKGKTLADLDDTDFTDARINPITVDFANGERLAYTCEAVSQRTIITAVTAEGKKKATYQKEMIV